MRFAPGLFVGQQQDLSGTVSAELARVESKALAVASREPQTLDQVARIAAGSFYVSPGTPYQPSWDTDRMVRDGYERVIWLWRGVDAIARRASRLTVRAIEEETRDAAAPRVVEDPVTDVLNGRANVHERGKWMRYRLSSQLLLSKPGVFVEVVPSRSGGVSALALLSPNLVSVIPGYLPTPTMGGRPPQADRVVAGFRVRVPGADSVDLPAFEPGVVPEDAQGRPSTSVLWVRLPHPTDPLSGTTPLEAAGLSIDLDYWMRLFNRNFMARDGRPGGILTIKGKMLPRDAEELKQRFSGPHRTGATSIIEADGVSWTDTSVSPRDAQYVEGRTITKDDIYQALGIPESVAGNSAGRTYANAAEDKAMFWEDTMSDHLDVLETGFEPLTQGGDDDGVVLWHDTSKVTALQVGRDLRRKGMLEEMAAGGLTLDEYLEATGREPMDVPGSRVRWIAGARVPVGADADLKTLAEQAAKAAPPAPGALGVPVGPPAADGSTQVPAPASPPALRLVKALPAAHQNTGLMVSLDLRADEAAALALPTGEPASELHVTLAYLGAAADYSQSALDTLRDRVAALAGAWGPLSGRVGGFGRFEPSGSSDGLSPLYASPDVPGLTELRADLVRDLESIGLGPSSEHGFTPHVTLAYLEPGQAPPGLGDRGSQPLHLGTIAVHAAGRVDTYELTGEQHKGLRELQQHGGWLNRGRYGGPGGAVLRGPLPSVGDGGGDLPSPAHAEFSPAHELTGPQLARVRADPAVAHLVSTTEPLSSEALRQLAQHLGGRTGTYLARRAEERDAPPRPPRAARVAARTYEGPDAELRRLADAEHARLRQVDPTSTDAPDEFGAVGSAAMARLLRDPNSVTLGADVTPYQRGTPEVHFRPGRDAADETRPIGTTRRAALEQADAEGALQALGDRVRLELGDRPTAEQLDEAVPWLWAALRPLLAPPPLAGKALAGAVAGADSALRDAERELERALVELLTRQEGVVLARLTGTKSRRGTRHWEPAGTKALDPRYALDLERWLELVREVTREAMRRVLIAAGRRAAAMLGATAPAALDAADVAVEAATEQVVEGMRVRFEGVHAAVAAAEADAQPMAEVERVVREQYDYAELWARESAASSVAGVFNEGLVRAAEAEARGAAVDKTWVVTLDGRARPDHAQAHGQTVPLSDPFVVGGHPMTAPHDRSAPPEQWANCRCTLVLTARASAR